MTTVENIVCMDCGGFGHIAMYSVFLDKREVLTCTLCGGYGVLRKSTTVKISKIEMEEMKVIRTRVYGH